MEIIKGKPFDLLQLGPAEKIDKEQIKSDGSVRFVTQKDVLFKLSDLPIHTVMTSFEPKDKEKFWKAYGETPYKNGFVYLIKNHWDEFRIARYDFMYVMKYFREIYNKFGHECAVLLMVNLQDKKWKVVFVPQVGTGGAAVTYLTPMSKDANFGEDKKEYYEEIFKDKACSKLMLKSYEQYKQLINEGYLVYGTIHSHCNFSAFHSGVDDNDEQDFDGLHITIGNVNSGWSFSARYMLAGAEFKINDMMKVVHDLADEAELKSDDFDKEIDAIQIDQYHLDLMMTSIERPQKATYTSTYQSNSHQGSTSGGSWKHDPTLWERNQQDGYGTEYEENINFQGSEFYVFRQDKIIYLYDNVREEIVVVVLDYYCRNKSNFSTPRYTVLPDRKDGPDDKPSRKDQKIKPDEDTNHRVDCLILFEDPEISPNVNNPEAMDIAMEIQNINSIAKKATKVSTKK